MTKTDKLNKRRFASISIKNCLADTEHWLISNLAQLALRFASPDFLLVPKMKRRCEPQTTRFQIMPILAPACYRHASRRGVARLGPERERGSLVLFTKA